MLASVTSDTSILFEDIEFVRGRYFVLFAISVLDIRGHERSDSSKITFSHLCK